VPVVLRHRGIRIFFFSNEGNPREPIHIHALRGDAEAKIWLDPRPRVANNVGFAARTIADLLELVERHRDVIEEAWHEHFG
jgi:hypothetical protein